MATALVGSEGSASRPSHTLPPGNTRYPLYRRLGDPQSRSGHLRKISPQPGFNPQTVQSVASCYTDYATRPTSITQRHFQMTQLARFRSLEWLSWDGVGYQEPSPIKHTRGTRRKYWSPCSLGKLAALLSSPKLQPFLAQIMKNGDTFVFGNRKSF